MTGNDKKIIPTRTDGFIRVIKHIIEVGRTTVYSAVSQAMITTYWNIGRCIVEEGQQGKERTEYGKELIKMLARELRHEYGSGFSDRYLRAFRQFYIVVPNYAIINLIIPLSFSH